MSWIKTLSYEEADSRLRRLYDRIKGPNQTLDNVLRIHSLRPHTLQGHMVLYKSVLHHSANALPKWYLEALGVYVSSLNRCSYCYDHHLVGLEKTHPHMDQVAGIEAAIQADDLQQCFEGKWLGGFEYAKHLTQHPDQMREDHVINLRNHGMSDGEILEVNQVVSYFNYVNRSVLGLGVTIQGDILGLSPCNSSDPEDWSHA